jgi:hypothetical protein
MRHRLALIQPALASAWKKLSRNVVLGLLFFLPAERKIAVQRWLRGREQYRVMLSRFYQVKHGLPENFLLSFSNLHLADPAIPKIFFTHDNYLKDYSKNGDLKADYGDATRPMSRSPSIISGAIACGPTRRRSTAIRPTARRLRSSTSWPAATPGWPRSSTS